MKPKSESYRQYDSLEDRLMLELLETRKKLQEALAALRQDLNEGTNP